MHLEIRRHGRKKKYYLAHSFRDNDKVRKVRRFLGTDLTESEINKLRQKAEVAIAEQIKIYKRIRDPLHTMLSEKETEKIEKIISKADIKIEHLSEEDWKDFAESFTYNTNAIEGSTITEGEVKNILERGQWPRGKSSGDISETYGVSEAIDYIRKTKEHLSIPLMKELHRIVFKNSKDFAGRFRSKGIEVMVTDGRGEVIHRGAPQNQINVLLKELIKWYKNNKNRYHPIVLAVVVHNQFENIHPFQDGNGRIGRLLLNNILIRHRLPPVNIELKNRSEYYSSLREYEKNDNIRPSIELVLKEYKELKKLSNR